MAAVFAGLLVGCFACVCAHVKRLSFCTRPSLLLLIFTQEKKKDEAVDGDDSAKDKKDKKKKVIVGVW